MLQMRFSLRWLDIASRGCYKTSMKRREFLRTSLTVSTLAGLSGSSLTSRAAEMPGGSREIYELRQYRLKDGASHEVLDAYLEKAAIPAWNRLGCKPIGIFGQLERKAKPAATEAVDPLSIFVLIPYPSFEAFGSAAARLAADREYQAAGAPYLDAPKSAPAYDRFDSWLMLAFAGMPKLEQPGFSKDRKPRMFEMRTYESHSEAKALKKVEMFNAGEIQTMREVGLAPIFYGQGLIGGNLPHLTYLLSGESEEAHAKQFVDFGKHPVWNKLKNDPQYADTVSKIVIRFLEPKPYSQI